MNGNDFNKDLANPKHIYCLVSTDSALIDLYSDRFKKAINADAVSYGEIKSFGKLFNKKVLNILYVTKIDSDIFNRSEFIFMYIDKIDKRSAVYKQYKDHFIEPDNDYTKYITDHSNLTEKDAKQFAIRCNNDLGIIKNRLVIYNYSKMTYTDFIDNSSDIFLWIDCFFKSKQLPNIDESPIGLLSLLSVNCSNLLKIKEKDTIGMNPYIINCMKDLVNIKTKDELVQIINDCFYLDCQIKKGLISPDYVIPYILNKHYKGENYAAN